MIENAVTDEALLVAARTDAEAFTRFYRRHAAPVLGYLVRRTRDPELGADLTAETFACALEGLARFDPERGTALNWLFGIARHQLLYTLQRGKVERRARDAGTVAEGELSVCTTTRDGVSLSGLYVNGQRLAVPRMTQRGHWTWAAASPDGKAILAQWSGECEAPHAFLLDADGGSPRTIGPLAAASGALGWTTDGRAIVFFRSGPACGSEWKPGLYLVSPDAKERTRVPGVLGTDAPFEPSVQPRDVGEISSAP